MILVSGNLSLILIGGTGICLLSERGQLCIEMANSFLKEILNWYTMATETIFKQILDKMAKRPISALLDANICFFG